MEEVKGNPKIQLLTDEIISMYSEDNVLTDYRDINLKVLNKVDPYPNGPYDQDIFGSVFSDRCNCGNIRTPGVRCPRCGSMLLDEVSSFRRFARIESPVYYSSKYKLIKLIEFLKNNFSIKTDFKSPYFEGLPWNDGKVLDICQWSYNKDEDYLLISDNITDFTKCSYEGLVSIIQINFPELLEEYRSYINQYILVIPMALRAPVVKVIDGERKLDNHQITTIYQNLIYDIFEYYAKEFPSMKTESGKSIFRGSLRKLISSSLDGLSQLMNSSKQNLARTMQSNRLPNSGRCTIVPDPTLTADEVTIPRHLMYETCREEFIKYIADKKNISLKEAEVIYKTQSDLDEVQKMFDDYVYGESGKPETAKHVIINRAPSLYEMSMFTCRVKMTHDYVMKIPQSLCKPTNGDFDGDTFSYYSIPKEMNNMMIEALGAKNRFLYKKNHQPLFTPTHEFMQGLIQATKVDIPDKREVFDSLEDVIKYKKNTKGFRYQTMFILNGRETTLAREILSEYFDKDINAYLGDFKTTLNSKNIILLYEQLRDKEDRLERIQKIQQFAAKIATLSGATAPRLSELYIDIDQTYLDRIKAIENNDSLDQKAKEIAIRDIYQEFQKVELDKIPEGVKLAITESSRAKLNQLRDMAVQQLNVGPDHKFSIAETTLVQGLSPIDYERHAIENRATQDIKQLSVPRLVG